MEPEKKKKWFTLVTVSVVSIIIIIMYLVRTDCSSKIAEVGGKTGEKNTHPYRRKTSFYSIIHSLTQILFVCGARDTSFTTVATTTTTTTTIAID